MGFVKLLFQKLFLAETTFLMLSSDPSPSGNPVILCRFEIIQLVERFSFQGCHGKFNF